MDDIPEIERRIAAALDRIGAGLDGLGRLVPEPEIDPDAPTVEGLQAELDAQTNRADAAEAYARKQADRMDTLETERDARADELRAQGSDLVRAQARAEAAEAEMARLVQVNALLRDNNRALREANEGGLADAGLVEDGLRAELQALAALRAADRAEIDAVLAELAPALDRRRADA